ncbi:MAG: tetratricopeptide repeat protein [Candidatus Omnitrophica bacterium]|jgi:tetratricopeptide (TPR) repeat protein|nr:tetratricopeptide repeat protein [Candidatus Omnitrophota bacterium]
MKKTKRVILIFILMFSFTQVIFALDNEEEKFFVASKAFSDGFYEASFSLFKKFTEDFPGSKDVYSAKLYMAKCLYYKGDYSAALPILNELLSKTETAQVYDEINYLLAQVYLRGKNFSNSLVCAKKIISDYPQSKFLWQAYYLAGLNSLELGDVPAAQDYLEQTISQSKENNIIDDAYSSLFDFYFQQKNYSRIISLGEKYEKFLKAYPKSKIVPTTYFYLGESFYDRKDFERASHYYHKALEISNDDYLDDLIYQGLAFSLIAKGSNEEAKSSISEIKDAQVKLFCEGTYYFRTGNYQNALDLFEKFLRDFSQSKMVSNIYLAKADTLYEMGRINDSLSAYRYILDNFKNIQYSDVLDKAHYGLAWCYLKKGEFRKAIEEFKNTLKYTNNLVVMVSSQIQIADAYQEAGNFTQALDVYNEILANNPNTVYTDYIQFQIGMVFLKSKKLEESLVALRNLQKNFPSSKLIPQAQYYLAVGYFSQDNYHETRLLLEDFIKKFSQDELLARVYYLYGKCFFNEGKYQKAADIFKEMIDKFKDGQTQELGFIDIGNCYLNLSEFDKARKIWEEFLVKFKSSPYAASVALYLGGLYEKEQNYEEAEKYYKMTLDNYRDSSIAAEAMFSLGHLAMMKEDYAKAEDYFRKISLSDDPVSLKAKIYLAKIYVRKGLTKDALGLYDDLMSSSPNISKAAMLEKALLLKDTREYEQASKLFRKLINQGVDSMEVRFSLASCLEKMEKNKEAIEEYFKVIYLFSSAKDSMNKEAGSGYEVKSYFRIAKIYEKENKIEAAKELYQKIAGSDTEESRIAKMRLEELGAGK